MSIQTEPKVRTRVVKKSVTPFFDKKTLYITLLIIFNIVVLAGLDFYFFNNFSLRTGLSGHASGLPHTGKGSDRAIKAGTNGIGPGSLFTAWVSTGNSLYSKGLYSEAAQILEQAVLSGNSSDPLMAGAAFKLGKINLEYLKKPSQAAKWFFLVQNISFDETLKKEAQKLLVNSLERAGKSQAARNILSSAVTKKSNAEGAALGKNGSSETGTSTDSSAGSSGLTWDTVAQVGDRKYSFVEFKAWADAALAGRKQGDKGPSFDTPQGREQLLQNFLGREILYESGIRKGYENDSFTTARLDEIKKDIIANRVYQEEIIKKLNPDDEKLRLFYEAHKELFKGKPFNECAQQVFNAYIQSAQANASAEAVARLLGGEDVKIHRDALFRNLGKNGSAASSNAASSNAASLGSSGRSTLKKDVIDPTKSAAAQKGRNETDAKRESAAEKQVKEQIKAQLKQQFEAQKGKTVFDLPGASGSMDMDKPNVNKNEEDKNEK